MLAALSSYVNSDTLSQVGCWGLQCTVHIMYFQWGKTPKIAHSFWDYVTPLEEDRAPAIGNMHNLADRQTHTETHTQTCSLQYFATAAAGVVIITEMLKIFICRKSMHGPRPVTPGQRQLGRVGSRVRSSDRFRLCFICHSGRDLVSD